VEQERQTITEHFLDLLERSIIVQSTITIMLVAVLCYLLIAGKTIPDILVQLTLSVLGFWMGSKSTSEVHKSYEKRKEQL